MTSPVISSLSASFRLNRTSRRRIPALLSGLCLLLLSHATPAPAAPGDPTTPQGIFDDMRNAFRADRARGVYARYQFQLSDPQGGLWWIVVNDGRYEMGKGALEKPDVIFLCTGTDWVRISNGEISGFRAYVTGRLHVRGNTSLARKLDEIFP